MTLIGITALMILAIFLGKRHEKIGVKEYLIIALIAMTQVLIAAFEMFTKQIPPYR